MLYGYKGYINGVYVIKVYDFPRIRYFFYNAKDAEREYRRDYGLKYKKIIWSRPVY